MTWWWVFKGNHYDKNNITYKSEGHVFHSYALFQCSFTCHIFMRNDPDPPKYVDNYFSSLWNIDGPILFLKNMYDHCNMDSFINILIPFFIYSIYIHIWMSKICLNPFICHWRFILQLMKLLFTIYVFHAHGALLKMFSNFPVLWIGHVDLSVCTLVFGQ